MLLMKLKRSLMIVACVVALAFCSFRSAEVYAADASVIFGSDSYENASGEEVRVGLYINGDSSIGYYRVEISYDPGRLEYLDGATSGENGTIVFEGNGASESVSTMLRFRALSGGATEIGIANARVRASGADEEFNITEMAKVPVVLTGEDTVGETPAESTVTEETSPGTVESETITESSATEETKETTEDKQNSPVSFRDSEAFWPVVIILPLAGVLALILGILAARKSFRRKRLRKEYARKFAEGREQKEEKASDKAAEVKEMPSKAEAQAPATQKEPSAPAAKKEPQAPAAKNDPSVSAAGMPAVSPSPMSETPGQKDPEIKGEPVIQVRNVSMTFNVTNAATSGLKEYMIQKVKGNLKRRRLNALEDISFDVYKGEVVGVIGTNGSGKSTLLKIVSGALIPTSGEVIADKRKIQLLTLGTGFDGELSARENVYLNGAIIGYTKEFIDKHYDEIVEFAELKDFMEEQVKNFSSGMVSRLGFSIATVAGAAEILILDEVLSVGDQFFRKKSLERIRQMIHGGSTVLIVSHGMATIRQHCTKVIWIEKGKLKMVGSPEMVCDAYANQLNEIKKNESGDLAYYVEGELQGDYSGYVKTAKGDSVIVKDGIVDTEFSYAKMIKGVLTYFENGIEKKDFTGIAVTEANRKAYFKNGAFRNDFYGLIRDKDDRLLYFFKGLFAPGFSGMFLGANDLYKVEKGIAVKTEYKTGNGSANDLQNNVKRYTGYAMSTDGKWHFVRNGISDEGYTGLAYNPTNRGWFYAENGVYKPGYTGAAKSTDGNLYYVKNSKWEKNYTGTFKDDSGKTYNVKDGRIV